MFNIGGGELIVILLIALIVLGPKRLPDAARQLGKAMGDLRRLSTGFQNEMKQALDTADDPNRVTARRNVLSADVASTDPEPDPEADDTVPAPAEPDAAADSIAAVSAQPSAPGKQAPPASQERSASKRIADAAETADSSSVPEPPAPPTTT